MPRLIVGPFNRVEGDLEVTLDIDAGQVRAAYVNSPLFRGFEQILAGRDPLDALVFVPRICGICSVAQSRAAAAALAQSMGLAPPRNGEIANNLVLAAENLADHFTHFYLFFMPDFARTAYAGHAWHASVEDRFAALRGSAAGEVVAARARFLELMGFLAGRWPHTLGLQPGGTTRALEASEKLRVYAIVREFRAWLERNFFGDSLEAFGSLSSAAELWAWCELRGNARSDLCTFLGIARELALDGVGRAGEVFMSYGAYPEEGRHTFRPGVWDGTLAEFSPDDVAEDASHAWLESGGAVHPFSGATAPLADKAGAYSWCKAPRWRGRVVETGALARQVVDGHPLMRDLVRGGPGNVMARVLARAVELARVLPRMEAWARALVQGQPYCLSAPLPQDARGVGLIEAARGSLGHWMVVERGRIRNYQIVAPTTWNFSPRDAAGTPGALESALVGLPVAPGEREPVLVQHVVRSFDPCMVCTVH